MLFTEAVEIFLKLIIGEKLPQYLNGFFRLAETRRVSAKFNTQFPIVEETNMTVSCK